MSEDLLPLFDVKPRIKKTVTPKGIFDEEDWFRWEGYIKGPEATPYHGYKFFVEVVFPQTYPLTPPSVVFKTSIMHPNISSTNGSICLNILKLPPAGDWSPSLGIEQVLLSIHNLLSEPNPNDPLNTDAAYVLKNEPEAYFMLVKSYCEQFGIKQ